MDSEDWKKSGSKKTRVRSKVQGLGDRQLVTPRFWARIDRSKSKDTIPDEACENFAEGLARMSGVVLDFGRVDTTLLSASAIGLHNACCCSTSTTAITATTIIATSLLLLPPPLLLSLSSTTATTAVSVLFCCYYYYDFDEDDDDYDLYYNYFYYYYYCCCYYYYY